MIRKIKFQNRKKINNNEVNLELNDDETKLNLDLNINRFDLPSDSQLYLEIKHVGSPMRRIYNLGSWNLKNKYREIDISEFTDLSKVYTIYVTNAEHLILASTENLRMGYNLNIGASNIKIPILITDFTNEIKTLWNVIYNGNEIILQLNNNIPNIRSMAKEDPLLMLSIYPAVLKEILTHFFMNDSFDIDEENFQNWYNFIINRLKITIPDNFDDLSFEEKEGFIKNIVDRFTKINKFLDLIIKKGD